MTQTLWDRCRSYFEWDGSWRDIYVHDVTVKDWDRFVAALPDWEYETQFLIDGEPAAFPRSTQSLFDAQAEHSSLLKIHIGDVLLCSHFFSDREIELDLDPRELKGESELAAILEFATKLAGLLQREVVLTPENMPEHPLITCASQGPPLFHGEDGSRAV